LFGKALKPKEIYLLNELHKTIYGKVMNHIIKAAFLNKGPGEVSSLLKSRSFGTNGAIEC
jgi:acetyl-CoA synthetase